MIELLEEKVMKNNSELRTCIKNNKNLLLTMTILIIIFTGIYYIIGPILFYPLMIIFMILITILMLFVIYTTSFGRKDDLEDNIIFKVILSTMFIIFSVIFFGLYMQQESFDVSSLYSLIAYPILFGFILHFLLGPETDKILMFCMGAVAIWAIPLSLNGFYRSKSMEEIMQSSLFMLICIVILFIVIFWYKTEKRPEQGVGEAKGQRRGERVG